LRSSRFRSQQLACETGGGLATDPYLWPTQATKAALRQAVCWANADAEIQGGFVPANRPIVGYVAGGQERSQTYELCLFVAVHMSLSGTKPTSRHVRADVRFRWEERKSYVRAKLPAYDPKRSFPECVRRPLTQVAVMPSPHVGEPSQRSRSARRAACSRVMPGSR
jgi:hypothetical protein